MKKLRLFITTLLLMFVLAFTGCQSEKEQQQAQNQTVEHSGDLQEIGGSLAEDFDMDEEMFDLTEEELASVGEFTESYGADVLPGGAEVIEDGEYTDKESVAAYIHNYGHLPSNFITKNEAKDLGWVSKEGNLDEVAPGMSIGGDKFGNYEGLLPEEDGRVYYECDIDFDGTYRNAERIVFSNDGLIFYTEDHYESFEQLY